MITRIAILFVTVASALGEVVILQDPSPTPVPRLWTNSTDGLRVISYRGGADWRDYKKAGNPIPAQWPAIVDTETGQVVEQPASVDSAIKRMAREEQVDVPDRVREAHEKLDDIGLRLGLTNKAPNRVLNKVMRSNTNAANAVLRAEAVHAYWTIRDYRLARKLGLAAGGEE